MEINKFKKNPASDELILFMGKVGKLHPIQFNGLLSLTGLSFKENDKIKSFEEVISEIFDYYVGLPKNKRKELYRLVSDTIKENEEGKEKQGIDGMLEEAAAVFSQRQKDKNSLPNSIDSLSENEIGDEINGNS